MGKPQLVTGKKLKLGILVSHPIQYFVPVYRELAKTCGIDLTVLYRTRVGVDAYYDAGFGQTVQWDIPLLDGYKYQFLSDKKSIKGVEWNILRAILGSRLDVLLVHGYNRLTNVLAILLARLIGTKVLIRGDTRMQAHHENAGLRTLVKRTFFKCCNGFVTIGTLNREYYAQHGVPPNRLFFAPFCVRNEQFAASPGLRAQYQREVRTALAMTSDSLIILSAAKLMKLKRTDDLIRAFAALTEDFPDAWLVIAGSGSEEDGLMRLAESLGIFHIRFIGFQNQTQLPPLYAASDIFVLCSHLESWGLAINEAMAAGLPAVVSSEVGAAPDLVAGKGTGIVYPCGDVDALSQAIRLLLSDASQRQRMAQNAVKLIQDWDVPACASGILRAAHAVDTAT